MLWGYYARMASEAPPSRQMTELLSGFQVSQALYVAAKLDLATLMEEGPRSVEDLAAASGAQAEPLGRLLRSLSSLGVFTMVEPGSFVLTPLGATLASGRPDSLRDLALTYMEAHYGPFSNLLETLSTGEPAAEIYGEQHLRQILAEYSQHYNEHRPHQSREQRPPLHEPGQPVDVTARIKRRQAVHGLISEYRRAA